MTQRNTEIENGRKQNVEKVDSKILFFDSRIDSSNWLTTKEAAEYLRTKPKQVRKWVYQGRVDAYRLLGKSLRFKKNELDLLFKGGSRWA